MQRFWYHKKCCTLPADNSKMYTHGLSIYIPGGEGSISSSREQNTELSDSLMILLTMD
jgi:hypothetical protein